MNHQEQIQQLILKVAELEAKNRVFEGRLTGQEIKAKIQERKAENNSAIHSANNGALAKIMANFKEEFLQMLESLENKHKHKIADLELENLRQNQKTWEALNVTNKKLEQAIQTGQKKMEEFATEMAIVNKQIECKIQWDQIRLAMLEKAIQTGQKKMEEFGAEMAIVKKQIESKIQWDQIRLAMVKKLGNPKENVWNGTNRNATISADGLQASKGTSEWLNLSASKGFAISVEQCRMDHFPGTILYYFEVTQVSSSERSIYVGLSNGNLSPGETVACSPTFYGLPSGYFHCYLSKMKHSFEWPNGAPKPKLNGPGDVIGCGLVMSPANGLAIFFTANGTLMGEQIPIDPPTVDHLYPTVSIHGNVLVEANFGDNSAKPFSYDIDKFPGLVLQ